MEPDDIPVDDENDTRACPDCDATGYDDEDGSPCGNCGGLGYVEAACGVAPSCCGRTMPYGFRCTGCPHAKAGDTLVPREEDDEAHLPDGVDVPGEGKTE